MLVWLLFYLFFLILVERRRRYNINDRIKELGDLLPKQNEPYVICRVDCWQDLHVMILGTIN